MGDAESAPGSGSGAKAFLTFNPSERLLINLTTNETARTFIQMQNRGECGGLVRQSQNRGEMEGGDGDGDGGKERGRIPSMREIYLFGASHATQVI
jgi:hypothetical protein